MRFEKTSNIINKFIKENKNRVCITENPIAMIIDPQKIIAINDSYDYPEILEDYKMIQLRDSVEKNGWHDDNYLGICLLQLPNGDLLVNGCGNHRAVLSKVLEIPNIKASVAIVKYVND